MKKKVKIFGKDIKRAVRRGLMENIVEGYEMKDTYSRADYEATPQETEIGGVFGKYEEDIPPAVLRYMRKNPGQIIKRLYGVYGNKMIEYITNTGKEGSIEFEDAIVAEEETMSVYDDSSNFANDIETEKIKRGQTVGIKDKNGSVKTITVNEINKLYEAKKKGGWMQKAFAKVEKEGHGGKFHDWCVKQNKNWDGCTKLCWDKAGEKKKNGEPKYDKQSKMVGLAKSGCKAKKK